ncbi:NUDIX hydrolase domain-like [Phytophthora cactorum]|nr:NUDIX hydrolase domain-like [Phytophthora cactorum]
MGPLPPPVPTDEAPRKKRRTLRDAEADLEAVARHCRKLSANSCSRSVAALHQRLIGAKLTDDLSSLATLGMQARENAKMKVLLMKYIEKDDSLLCSSQLSVGEASSQPTTSVVQASSPGPSSPPAAETDTSALSQSPREYTTAEEESEGSLWNGDFQPSGDGFTEPISQLSQISQISQWSELSSTSNLDAIINFLETQDTSETNRIGTLQAEYVKLKEQKTVVRVGVGVLLMSKKHPDCVLIGQRKGSHGEGKFALPVDTWKCTRVGSSARSERSRRRREAKFATVTNDPMENEGKHYITILMQAVVDDEQTVRNMEPNKCEGWSWVPWADLRSRDDILRRCST